MIIIVLSVGGRKGRKLRGSHHRAVSTVKGCPGESDPEGPGGGERAGMELCKGRKASQRR